MKKKGKSKASSHKASLDKLANKKTNRLAKQGKLHKVDKKKKKKKAFHELNEKKIELEKTQEKYQQYEENVDSAEDTDEDLYNFKHLKNAHSFIHRDIDSVQRGKKRKREEDEEQDYESKPRSFSAYEATENMKMMLPIISKGKVIQRMVERDETSDEKEEKSPQATEKETETDEKEVNEEADDEGSQQMDSRPEDELAYLKTLNTAQLFVYRKKKLAEKKEQISFLSLSVLEDPHNNMRKLKELRLMLGEKDPGVSLTIRKYAMVSLQLIFKDIIPGYRMRIPTEKERAQRVKKETKSLLDYEASFLLSYRIYLEFLKTMAKGKPIQDKTFLTKHGIYDMKMPRPNAVAFGEVALKCLCDMLVSHPHFNYRSDIISAIIPFTNHANIQYSRIACEAFKTVFKEDKLGEVTLEIVRGIGRMVKNLKFDVQPQVLETFLELKIKEVNFAPEETLKKMKRKEKMLKLSRRERKHMKRKEQLDKEMLETKASEDKNRKLKLHTETIQAVFETYIRVIKLASDSILLPAVLEGLAKFAHLINIEYLDSLFSAFNQLIESEMLTSRETLHCLQTAFTILSGQGSVLNVDPTGFYKCLYCTLPTVHAGIATDTARIVLECFDSMISRRRKQVSQQRILAFMKRVCSLSLQQCPETTLAYLAALRSFLHTYKYSDLLFDNEVKGSGVYLPYLDDPEHCNANSTSVWELHLLRCHYVPDVQKYAKHLLRMAPVAGEHQLNQELARKSPKDLYDLMKGKDIFEGIPEASSRKKKARSSGFACEDFGNYLQRVCDAVPPVNVMDELEDSAEGKMDTS